MVMIQATTDLARQIAFKLAQPLNRFFKGNLTSNHITLISFLGHFLVAGAIITEQWIVAAVSLAFFGLMDALDGAMARVQNNASPAGMLYDASSDRAKEALVYIGLTFYFAENGESLGAMTATAALGGALIVSYVKAKGETALKASKNVNREFSDGLMQFQVRISALVFAFLLPSLLIPVISVIAVLSWFTAAQRLRSISGRISHVDKD